MTTAFPETRSDVAYIETLTDEELAVLGGDDPLAVHPFLDELPADAQAVAKRVAFRGLLARGIVDPPSDEAVDAARAAGGRDDTPVDVMVRQDVQSLVALRRGAQLVVALARTTGAGQDYWYGYLIDDMALVEEVTEGGLHRFSLIREEQLLDLLLAVAVHPASGDATGAPVPMRDDPDRQPPPPILRTLGQALLRSDLVVRYPGAVAPYPTSLFTGPAGSWLVSHRDPERPVAFPMRAEELREHVRAAVHDARLEVATRHG